MKYLRLMRIDFDDWSLACYFCFRLGGKVFSKIIFIFTKYERMMKLPIPYLKTNGNTTTTLQLAIANKRNAMKNELTFDVDDGILLGCLSIGFG